MDIQNILDKNNNFAVVGASNDQNKYGYKVYKMLKDRGYKVYPINPNRDEVQGDKTFKTLADLPKIPDVVSVITPPTISLDITNQAESLGIKNIWFQPGAEDENVIKNLEGKKINAIYNRCILVEADKLNEIKD